MFTIYKYLRENILNKLNLIAKTKTTALHFRHNISPNDAGFSTERHTYDICEHVYCLWLRNEFTTEVSTNIYTPKIVMD